jgi:DNA polymerase-3 subunit delta'
MKYFKEINFHQNIANRLTKSLENGRLAHAYLFHGPQGTAKEATAIELAKAVNCHNDENRPCNECPSCQKITNLNHPDIQFIFPVNKTWSSEEIGKLLKKKAENPYAHINYTGNTTIQINRVRELQNQAKYTPHEADKKVYIISEADQMSRESANAFLKLLEEPPSSLMIILITTIESALLETIRSRCQKIYFPTLTFTEAGNIVRKVSDFDGDVDRLVHIYGANLKEIFQNIDRETDEKRQQVYLYLRAIASGNPYLLMESVDNITSTRDKNYLMDVLNLIILWFRDALHSVTLGTETELINVDFSEELGNFVKAFGNSNFELIVSDIENAVQNVNRNIYPPLLLTVLGSQIKRNLIRS